MIPVSSAVSAQAVFSLDDAARKVSQTPGVRILSANTEEIGGKPVHVIKYLTKEGRVQYQKIDQQSGKALKK